MELPGANRTQVGPMWTTWTLLSGVASLALGQLGQSYDFHSATEATLNEMYKCLTRVHWELMISWWPHQMETFPALLAICAGNSPVIGEFPAQRPVTRSFDVFFDLCLNKWLSKQSWSWWFQMPSRPLWCHCNETTTQQRHVHIFGIYPLWACVACIHYEERI